MLGYFGRQTRQFTVDRKRNPLYLPMMIAQKSHVPEKSSEILPTGKFTSMDHQPLQITVRFDPCIRSECQRIEVLRT